MTIRYNTLVLWISALLLCSWWAFSHIEMRTDMSLFLPEGTAPDQKLLLNEVNQGPANRLLMLAIKQGDSAGRARISQQFTAQLRKSPFFEQVENGTPSSFEIDPLLFKYRYLISSDDIIDQFSVNGLHAALMQRLEELKSPFPNPFKELLPADPLGNYQSMLRSWLAEHDINRLEGVWHSKDGEMALLLAQTKAGGLDLDQQQLILSFITAEFARVNNGQPYELIVSGPATFGVASRNIIHNESRNLSIIASLLIGLLLFVAYRFLPYLLIAALPLLSALLAGAVLCQLIFDELHGITLAFGITLLGVTLDYPIHLFSHLHKDLAVKQSMQRIWKTMRLGVYTTCIAYVVLMTTDFTGLRQLGLFTLTGLLTAALTSRFFLPLIFPEPFLPPVPRGLIQLKIALGQYKWPSQLLLIMAILSIASLLIPTTNELWQDDIATLSPLPQTLLKQDHLLRQQLASSEPNHLLLIRGETPESILQTSEALAQRLGNTLDGERIVDINLPSDYLPSQQKQRLKQQSLPNAEDLKENLQQGMKGTPFRESAFERFISDIQQSRTYAPLTYAQALETDLKPRLESMIRQGPTDWFALIPMPTESDSESFEAYVNNELPGVRTLNLRSEISDLVGDFREQILQRVAFGSLLMLLLLWYGLGSLKEALITLSPIALAILTTVGVLYLAGESLNLFHLISLMLVLGIGMDYSLFFSRQEQQGEALLTLHALSVCALSTVGVFAILASSSIPVLHAIGLTVAIGVAISYFATYAMSRRIS